MTYKDLSIQADRLQAAMEEMASIGATPGGGVQRLALSDEDRQGRDLLVRWLKELGLRVTVDRVGNIFGLRPGQKNLPPVLTGSHLDSQPKGGRFDGTLGVLAGLEVLRTLAEHRVETVRPVALVNWTNEEGTRFPPAMAGSGVWAGRLDLDWVYDQKDISGRRFEDELRRIEYLGTSTGLEMRPYAYLEYHIEQGPMLEKAGRTIGVPQGINAIHWYDVHVQGTANQVGPTPMAGRNDALCAAAEMILAVNKLPDRVGGNLVATVGAIHNQPNSRNIIPDQVRFTVDIRSWEDERAAKAGEMMREDFKTVADRRGCPVRIDEIWKVDRQPFDYRLVERVRRQAVRLGRPSMDMISGAGHDASYVALTAPTAMIFVPSRDGRSHVEVEQTGWEDCRAGADVLLHVILETAMED